MDVSGLAVNGRVPASWKGRCWCVTDDLGSALQRLSDVLGPPPETRTATSTPRASTSSAQPAGPTASEVGIATGSTQVRSSNKESKPASAASKLKNKLKKSRDDALHWDDIPEYDIDEEDALDKVVNFATVVYAAAAAGAAGAAERMQRESLSEEKGQEDSMSEAGSEGGSVSEAGGEGDEASEEGGEADSASEVGGQRTSSLSKASGGRSSKAS